MTANQTEQLQREEALVAFASLPIELCPTIFEFLQHRSKDLSRLSTVNRTVNRYSIPLLYQRLFLRDQSKLVRVFHSLAIHPHLNQHVEVLELKGFPFSLPAEQLEKLEENIVSSIQKMINLKSLIWTRSGSFLPRVGFQLTRNDRVLRTIFDNLHHLESLEITGDTRTYSPQLLLSKLRPEIKLKQLSVEYPDRKFIQSLPEISRRLGEDLKSLLIRCDASTLVKDSTLIEISKDLTGLERLSIVGCRSVTEIGIQALLENSRNGVRELAIEGLAIHPRSFPSLSRNLSSLRLLSLTHPRSSTSSSEEFYQSLSSIFPDLSSLVEFTLYAPNSGNIADDPLKDEDESEEVQEKVKINDRGPKLPTSFLKALLNSRGKEMRKLRIVGIGISNDQLGLTCRSCSELKDMAIQLFEGDKSTLFSNLSKLPNLQFLHILSNASAELILSEEDMRLLATVCNPQMENIGFRHRVWIVHRIPFTPQEAKDQVRIDGKKRECRVELRKWDLSSGRWPEVVMVVRS